jgi:hypothetical protein
MLDGRNICILVPVLLKQFSAQKYNSSFSGERTTFPTAEPFKKWPLSQLEKAAKINKSRNKSRIFFLFRNGPAQAAFICFLSVVRYFICPFGGFSAAFVRLFWGREVEKKSLFSQMPDFSL